MIFTIIICRIFVFAFQNSGKPVIEISHENKPILIRPGQFLSLEAIVKGQPEPDVTWTCDNNEISSDVKQTTDGNKYKIYKEKPEPEHVGVYKIKASNAAGEALKEIVVKILGNL